MMKSSSKDSKGDGSRQIRGGGSLETGALFPRLHVKETKNAGPRAPPRNKMALYEQLTIPTNSYPPPPPPPPSKLASDIQGSAANLPYPRQCPYNSGLVVPMYMAPRVPYPGLSIGHHVQAQTSVVTQSVSEAELQKVPGVRHLTGNLMVSSEAVLNLTSANMREKNVSSSGKKAEEDFAVPTFFSDKMSRSAPTDSRMIKDNPSQCQPTGEKVNDKYESDLTHNSCKSGNSETPKLQSRPGGEKNVPFKSAKAYKNSSQDGKVPKDFEAMNKGIILQPSNEHSCSSQQFSRHEFDNSGNSVGCPKVNVWLERSTKHGVSGTEVPTSRCALELATNNFLDSNTRASGVSRGLDEVLSFDQRRMGTDYGANNREVVILPNVRVAENMQPSSSNDSEGIADVENQTDGSAVEVSEPSQRAGEEESDDSDGSMVDSSPAAKVTPKDVIGAVGQHEFWKMRKAILKQQRIFAMQLFELHRLVRVQEIMVDGPTLQIEEIIECAPSASPKNELESQRAAEFPAAHHEQRDVNGSTKQNEVNTVAPALMESHPPEPVHHPVSFTENTQKISGEQQAGMYAAPYSFPMMHGQANSWGYSPYINPGLSHWVGPMGTGSAAYGYQPNGLPFSPFHPSLGVFNGPYGPMFGVPNPFELLPMYPLIGYEQRPGMYPDVYHSSGPSSNQNWLSPMHGNFPAGSAPVVDGMVPTLPPYMFPFVDPGQSGLSNVRGRFDHLAAMRGRPAVPPRAVQAGPLGGPGEPSSEVLDSTSTEPPRWNGNQFYAQHGENYGPFFGRQMPMHYAPRGVFPSLSLGHAEHGHSNLRSQDIAETAGSNENMPLEKSVGNVDHEQVQLFKRPRDGDQVGKFDQAAHANNNSNITNMTQEGLPRFPWGSTPYTFDYGRHNMSDGQHKQVIKAVPRAMVATAESAAEILHSIQQERQQ